jgi:UDP-glucose 4-epimerase
MISDYYTFRKHISVIILRLTIPVGGDSIFYDMYNNKNYIINNPSLQNNLLRYYFYDSKFNIYGCKYNTIDGSNNINLLSVYDIGMAFWRAYMLLDSQSRIFKTYNIANNNTLTIIQFIKLLTIYNDKNLIEKSIRFYILNIPSLKNSNKTYSIEKAETELNWRPVRSIFIDMSELIYHINNKKQQSNNTLYLNNDVFYPQNEYLILESND